VTPRESQQQSPATAVTAPRRLADLVLPLATLLSLAERPGEGHGLGPLDPALCRELAIAATGSPYSRLCVTVTDPDGIAIGHGCARSLRRGRRPADADNGRPAALPARVNLTITAARLAELAAATGPPGRASWAFTRDPDPGRRTGTAPGRSPCPPAGASPWNCGRCRRSTATTDRYESHAYQPNDALRHLVQVRDGHCTFPTCSSRARESDFEHATPYDKGGRTCACNAGARSRGCHRVMQPPGWDVTQPRPGWHRWVTPSGRAYVQGPKRHPA
jgi:hypothetical protein